MATIRTSFGTSISAPSGVEVVTSRSQPSNRSIRARQENEAIPEILNRADFESVEIVEVKIPARTRRRLRSSSRKDVELDVPVKAGHDAIILTESDGFFQWVSPDVPKSGRRTRGKRTFTLQASEHDAPDFDLVPQGTGRRNFLKKIKKLIFKKALLYILRFPIKLGLKALAKRIDGNGPFGLLRILGDDPKAWIPNPEQPIKNILGSSHKRILLFVHGTFSSTQGSFGNLADKNARVFYNKLSKYYDDILAFDHKTLGEDVGENADRLAQEISDIQRRHEETYTIDAIGYSRGGLVLRHFLENHIPQMGGWESGKAVFVGSTLEGTLLANFENWDDLLTLYSNTIAGATRVAGFYLGAAHITTPAAAVIAALGDFAKLIVQTGVRADTLPGLSSMTPDSPFVTDLHDGDYSESAHYHIIASDFEPGKGKNKKLSKKVKLVLADTFADQLFKESNDLVVHTRSMSSLAPDFEFKGDIHRYPRGEAVYHTIYFAQSETPRKLSDWLLSGRDPDTTLNDILTSNLPGTQPKGLGNVSQSEIHRVVRRRMEDKGFGFTMPIEDVFSIRGRGTVFEAARHRGVVISDEVEFETAGPSAPEPSKMSKPQAQMTGSRKPDKAPPSDVLVNFKAQSDEIVPLGEIGRVQAFISRDKLKSLQTDTDQAGAGVAQAEAPITIRAITLDNAEIQGADTQEVAIPLPGERPNIAIFSFKGKKAGASRLLIQFEQIGKVMMSLELTPYITTSGTIAVSHPAQLDVSTGRDNNIVLQILELNSDAGVSLYYIATCKDPAINFSGASDPIKSENIVSNVIGSLNTIENESLKTTQNYNRIMDVITGRGEILFDNFLPEKLRKIIDDEWDNISAIEIVSESHILPWELFKVRGKGFFADKGVIRWKTDTPWATRALDISPGNVRFLRPDYVYDDNKLKEAKAEVEALKKIFKGSKDIKSTYSDFCGFLENPGKLSILHIACHGESEGVEETTSNLILADNPDYDYVSDEIVRSKVNFKDSSGAVIFINACQVGRTVSAFRKLGGFADSFLFPSSGHGAAVFIGPLWSVGDKQASTFATTFYERLSKNDRLIDAVTRARQAAKDKKDPTWLSYSVYGNPDARFTKPD